MRRFNFLTKGLLSFLAIAMVLMVGSAGMPHALASTGAGSTAKRAQFAMVSIAVMQSSAYTVAYTIDNTTYLKLKDVAMLMAGTRSEFSIGYDQASKRVLLELGKRQVFDPVDSPFGKKAYTAYEKLRWEAYALGRTGKGYLSATPLANAIGVGNKSVVVPSYLIQQSTYVSLRGVADLIGCEVAYDAPNKIIQLAPKKASGEVTFNTALNSQVASWRHLMGFSRWASTPDSKLTVVGDKLEHLEVSKADATLTITTFDGQMKKLGATTLKMPLPIFGGHYFDGDRHYVIYGQSNMAEKPEVEGYRLVAYNREWQEVKSTSVLAVEAYTTDPFWGSTARMASDGQYLVVHTSRQRLKTEDGKHHQSQVTFVFDKHSLQRINTQGVFQGNHVSHSFNQYVQMDSGSVAGTHVLLDHGDAYPRSVVLHRSRGVSVGGYNNSILYDRVDLFKIPGASGANMTGVWVGDLVVSGSHYMAPIATVDHSLVESYTNFEMVGLKEDRRDIVLLSVPKQDLSEGAVVRQTIKSYQVGKSFGSVPYFVRLDDNRSVVVWQEFDASPHYVAGDTWFSASNQLQLGALCYQFVDGQGLLVGGVNKVPYLGLGLHTPVVFKGELYWTGYENGGAFIRKLGF